MSNENNTADGVAVEQAEPILISLEEFCIRLSSIKKSVELIGGFESDEIRAGRLRDTQEAFDIRFEAFANRSA